jgi:transposase
MPTDEELTALEARLEPAVKVVVAMMRKHNELLTETVRQLEATLASLRDELKDQRTQNAELRRMLFGRKSEKMPPMNQQVRRSLDAEELFPSVERDAEGAATPVAAPSAPELEKKRRQQGRKRSEKERKRAKAARKLKLPVLRERIAVEAEQLPEGYTLSDFRPLGEGQVVRRVEHVREHLVVVEYILQTLVSKDAEHLLTAPSPPSVQEGGHYGPGVYARVVVGKTVDSLPLNRLAKIFAREGAPIARSTLCTLFHRAAQLLEPLYAALVDLARGDPYVNADETHMPVQEKGQCRSGWIWTFITKSVIVYRFSPHRSKDVAEEFLGGTAGTLQVDGYSAYSSSCLEGGRRRAGCWGHARRGYFKCLKDVPDSAFMLERIVELYKVEYHAAERGFLGTDAHRELRQALSKPVIEQIKTWCQEQQSLHVPKSPLGQAIGYTLKQWDALTVFLDDPKIGLDNNVSERALRIQALGRKNFLFVGHDEAGQNLAILQSIVATCNLHGVNPYDYLADALIRVQTHPQSRIQQLLPMNWPLVDST